MGLTELQQQELNALACVDDSPSGAGSLPQTLRCGMFADRTQPRK